MMAEVLGGGIALQMLLGLDVRVDDLAQAAATLEPMLGPAARHIFALALLLAGLASSVTAGMAAGTVSAGIAGEPYDIHDRHSSLGPVGAYANGTALKAVLMLIALIVTVLNAVLLAGA